VRRRIVYKGAFGSDESFVDIWPRIAVSHVAGEESSEYIIRRSLLRPRNLLNLVNYCKSNAVNLSHPKILEDDLMKACASYSAEIGNEIGLEIRDVFPAAEDILYYFIGQSPWLALGDVKRVLSSSPISQADISRLIEILLWFSFLGVVRQADDGIEETYIYDVYYDMKKLKRLAADLIDDTTDLCIHRAFWPFLDIKDID
jgi:hypothetical protein